MTAHVDRLVSAGVSPQDIAVIAPYNLQVTTARAFVGTNTLILIKYILVVIINSKTQYSGIIY